MEVPVSVGFLLLAYWPFQTMSQQKPVSSATRPYNRAVSGPFDQISLFQIDGDTPVSTVWLPTRIRITI